ncbi:MAG TPA: purine-nucleoside phosphorylase, partial [Gemmataceae bacterium]|nr:purine-nucleoside phosphorylase [Gemmataceae bacterium]
MTNTSFPAFSSFAEVIRANPPDMAFVLGSGMGAVADRVEAVQAIHFGEIPGMTAVSVSGHRGRLTFGNWAGRRVLLFEGRLHYYEGLPWRSVVVPVQTAAFLGARLLFLTNAAGGIHE